MWLQLFQSEESPQAREKIYYTIKKQRNPKKEYEENKK